MMYADFYRLTTVLQTVDSPEYPRESAGGAKEEGERESDGEEDVLVRGIGVEAALCLQIPHFLRPTYIPFYSRSTD
jgi:hypothetical protein